MPKQKIICFYIGDMKIDYNEYIIINSKDINSMVSKNLENKTYVANVKELGLRANNIKDIIDNANNPIIFIFDKKPDWYKDVKDKVELIDKSDNIDFMKIIELILFEKDRDKVLEILNTNKISHEPILKWFYGCYDKLNQNNIIIIDYIDDLLYKCNEKYLNVLFSKMTPEKKPYNIFQFLGSYKFKKDKKEIEEK